MFKFHIYRPETKEIYDRFRIMQEGFTWVECLIAVPSDPASPGLVVVLAVDQLWVWSEHQLDLRARPLSVASPRRGGAAAVRLAPRAVLRRPRPLVARPGL